MTDLADLLSRANKLPTSSGAAANKENVFSVTANTSGLFNQSLASAGVLAATESGLGPNMSLGESMRRLNDQSLNMSHYQQPAGAGSRQLNNTANIGGAPSTAAASASDGGGALPLSLDDWLQQRQSATVNAIINETLANNAKAAEQSHWQALADDWKAYKMQLLADAPTPQLAQGARTQKDLGSLKRLGAQVTSLSADETRLARCVSAWTDECLRAGVTPTLGQALVNQMASHPDQETIQPLWRQVAVALRLRPPTGSLAKFRQSRDFERELLRHAIDHYQQEYKRHMECVVYQHMDVARRGGQPGTLGLVQAYIKVHAAAPMTDVMWPTVLCCIRAGDYAAAAEYLTGRGGSRPAVQDVLAALNHYAQQPHTKLLADFETKLKLEYARHVRSSADEYRKAVYAWLCDCGEPTGTEWVCNDSMEGYMIMSLRLAQHATNAGHTDNGLRALQTRVKHMGEEHFAGSGNPLLYWQALWLSGQFEPAIEYLWRTEQQPRLSAHAVHIGMALHNNRLLLTPSNANAALLSRDADDVELVGRLNIARLLLLYVSKFDQTDPKEALDYLYYLKDIKLGSGENAFAAAVTQLVRSTKENHCQSGLLAQTCCELMFQYARILGHVDAETGERRPGLIDRFSWSSAESLITQVAEQCEMDGNFVTAVTLYDLAKSTESVLRVLCNQLCLHVAQPQVEGGARDTYVTLATRVMRRYQKLGVDDASELSVLTFQLPMDLARFFDLYHSGRHVQAFQLMRQLELVPRTSAELISRVEQYSTIPEQVRRVIGDCVLALMHMLVACHGQLQQQQQQPQARAMSAQPRRHSHQNTDEVMTEARSLIEYVGLIPNKFPASINSQLIQLQSRLH